MDNLELLTSLIACAGSARFGNDVPGDEGCGGKNTEIWQ